MRAFTRKLVERLSGGGSKESEPRPLSRNRHFHTFETSDGRRALKISRHLRSLERDLLALGARGAAPLVRVVRDGREIVSVEIEYARLRGRRTAFLTREEFEILLDNAALRRMLRVTA